MSGTCDFALNCRMGDVDGRQARRIACEEVTDVDYAAEHAVGGEGVGRMRVAAQR